MTLFFSIPGSIEKAPANEQVREAKADRSARAR
jgi:hypothetical protein